MLLTFHYHKTTKHIIYLADFRRQYPLKEFVDFFTIDLMKLPRDITHVLLCSTLVILSCLLSACQKPATDIVHESKKPVKKEKPVPDLSQICQNLKQEMMAMNAQRTTLAIEQVNQDIRLCLPLMQFPEQKELMKLSSQMYHQFLALDRTSAQQQAFETYTLDQSAYPTIQQSHFEQLNLRDQYLLRHKGQAYIELVDHGNEQIIYRRSPQYLAKVFAPYLPEAEQVFIENLAEQNTQPLFKNNKLEIEPDELAKRALFWQDYVDHYPHSAYLADAKFLKNVYASLLFLGPEKSPISSSFENENDINANNLMVIERLARTSEGELSIQAKKFEKFIAMDIQQRKQSIPLSNKEQDKLENHPQLLALSQLNQFLNLRPLDLKHSKRDCFSDAICS